MCYEYLTVMKQKYLTPTENKDEVAEYDKREEILILTGISHIHTYTILCTYILFFQLFSKVLYTNFVNFLPDVKRINSKACNGNIYIYIF